jgi:hypothetical protein
VRARLLRHRRTAGHQTQRTDRRDHSKGHQARL